MDTVKRNVTRLTLRLGKAPGRAGPRGHAEPAGDRSVATPIAPCLGAPRKGHPCQGVRPRVGSPPAPPLLCSSGYKCKGAGWHPEGQTAPSLHRRTPEQASQDKSAPGRVGSSQAHLANSEGTTRAASFPLHPESSSEPEAAQHQEPVHIPDGGAPPSSGHRSWAQSGPLTPSPTHPPRRTETCSQASPSSAKGPCRWARPRLFSWAFPLVSS